MAVGKKTIRDEVPFGLAVDEDIQDNAKNLAWDSVGQYKGGAAVRGEDPNSETVNINQPVDAPGSRPLRGLSAGSTNAVAGQASTPNADWSVPQAKAVGRNSGDDDQ
jgi:hypothetical protein